MNRKPLRLMDRVRSLRTRHSELDNRIRDEMARPMPDGLRVQTLKRLRLKAKDQIALIARQLATNNFPRRPDAA